MVSFMRLRQRRKVDLPHPDGPIIASTWFLRDVDADFLDGVFLAVVHVDVAAAEDRVVDRDVAHGLARLDRRLQRPSHPACARSASD